MKRPILSIVFFLALHSILGSLASSTPLRFGSPIAGFGGRPRSRRQCLHKHTRCRLSSRTAFLGFGRYRLFQDHLIDNTCHRHLVSLAHNMSASRILESPSAERNKGHIWDVLANRVFPSLVEHVTDDSVGTVRVIEVAAGCGVHTVHFASSFLQSYQEVTLEWRPSDPDPEARASIDAKADQAGLVGSILPASAWILGRVGGTACGDGDRGKKKLEGVSSDAADVLIGDEETEALREKVDLIVCINMIHIAPWQATLALISCAGQLLRKGGILFCYGPYKVGGTAVQSNLNFDASLRTRDSRWGLRHMEEVVAVSRENGLELVEIVEMPANNLSLLFRKK